MANIPAQQEASDADRGLKPKPQGSDSQKAEYLDAYNKQGVRF